jgi:hypothetical protein
MMKLLLRALLLATALAAHAGAHAQVSLLRVTCEGNDIGAEVTLNGKFRGECPLDIQAGSGTVKLRVVKKVDATHERVFEREFRMGDGVMKTVEAVFSAPRLNPGAQSAEDKRLGPERAEAAKRERARQDALSLEPRRDEASLALLRAEAESRVAAFKRSAAYTSSSGEDAAEIVRILMLPIENPRYVMLADAAAIRAFIEADPFFETSGGSQAITESYKEYIKGGEVVFKVNRARSGRFVQSTGRMDFPAFPEHFFTFEGQDVLAGIVGFKGSVSKNNVPHSRAELTQIASVYGQPFPLVAGKRFGLTTSETTTGTDPGVKTGTLSCAVSSRGSTQSAPQAVQISCLAQRASQPDYYALQRHAWQEAAGCFVRASQ